MHMSDALISPAVGGTMAVVSAGLLAYAVIRLRRHPGEANLPLMGVMGAFVFATQMVNFAIPGTGSSGHLSGAILLAALLGPWAGLLTMAAILTIQAVFFSDGGIIALGCNIFNMGFWGAIFAYFLIYRPLVGDGKNPRAVIGGATLAGIVALQGGAFSVVLETLCSNITELPFTQFLLLMQPIHLAIGLVEGLATGLVLAALYRLAPELSTSNQPRQANWSGAVIGLGVAALVISGGIAHLASERPDGLEWSVEHTATAELPEPETAVAAPQIMPDYNFAPAGAAGSTVAGLSGTLLALAAAFALGWGIKRTASRRNTTAGRA